jgi:hypothetical protein
MPQHLAKNASKPNLTGADREIMLDGFPAANDRRVERNGPSPG